MNAALKVLVVIPARGGSKGIPRKNLRKLAGRPLIEYSIRTALASGFAPDVYVSSDDEEILSVARSLGAKVLRRDAAIAADATTLDPVVYDACLRAEQAEARRYDVVATVQPTSPLLTPASLDAALRRLVEDSSIDTVIAARDDTHLRWTRRGGGYVPEYEKRVNRQFLPPQFRETGAFLIARRDSVTAGGRIGKQVELHLLSGGEEIDIDSVDDWTLCEYHLRKQKILFVVTGNATVGLGHVHNTLVLANDILNHPLEFLVDRHSQLAYDEIAARNYPVRRQVSDDLVGDIVATGAKVVINDRLDTDEDYVLRLKASGLCVINFEDLGPGARHADLVINAIYPEAEMLPRHHFGPRYFVLRDEFLLAQPPTLRRDVRRVLLTFGGVDPNNVTRKVVDALHGYCRDHGIQVSVVAGFGYQAFESLETFEGIEVIRNTRSIAEHMVRADVIFTSAGRTTYEVASLGIPCLVLAQNAREMTHFFASERFGFENLGLAAQVAPATILDAFRRIAESPDRRAAMSAKMKQTDLRHGRDRVNALINGVLAARGAPDR